MRPTRRIAAATLAALALTAACGGDSGDDGGNGGNGGNGDERTITWPESPTTPVLVADSGGGLPPPDPAPTRFAAVPDVVVYGDGRAVWRGDDGFHFARLDTEGVALVLGWADEAGLLTPGGVDTGEPEVFDLPSTWYEVTTDDGTEQTRVMAPGFEDQGVGLTDDQIEARARIAEFRDRLVHLSSAVPDERFLAAPRPLDAPGWEVLTRPSRVYPDLTGAEPAWTLDDPAEVGRCRVVSTEATDQLGEQMADPTEPHYWAVDGERWVAFIRPLLPGAARPCGDRTTVRLTPADPAAAVQVGDRVLVELPENPSVGDLWMVTEPPDGAVVEIVGDTYVADEPVLIGSGGVRVFTLEAVGRGRTTVVFHNCYRCDAAGDTPPEDAQEAVDQTFEITVD